MTLLKTDGSSPISHSDYRVETLFHLNSSVLQSRRRATRLQVAGIFITPKSLAVSVTIRSSVSGPTGCTCQPTCLDSERVEHSKTSEHGPSIRPRCMLVRRQFKS